MDRATIAADGADWGMTPRKIRVMIPLPTADLIVVNRILYPIVEVNVAERR
jgi:hypothetical protein